MATLATPSVNSMRQQPVGSFSKKMMADVVSADLPLTSNVIRPGYAGAGSVILMVELTGGTKATSFDCMVEGRMGEGSAWTPLLTLSLTDTTLTGDGVANVIGFARISADDSAANTRAEACCWPEYRIVFGSMTGGTNPVYDAWIAGSAAASK